MGSEQCPRIAKRVGAGVYDLGTSDLTPIPLDEGDGPRADVQAGYEIPHYCFHHGLSVAGSCRLCAVETGKYDDKNELVMNPKLVMACKTPIHDGLVVRSDTEKVRSHQKDVMEFLLINHPLDCPVCDQAGECHLQDYSYEFGRAESRMVDEKHKNPKKDIGPATLLYSDRCVACTRCVRFTREVSGTSELCVVNRGSRAEIDVFPGVPLDNALQGNVVDICPVGCLLDKDFLFKRRVWELRSANSICPTYGMPLSAEAPPLATVISRAIPGNRRVMMGPPEYTQEATTKASHPEHA